MIDRLVRAWHQVATLPESAQTELAAYIESLLDASHSPSSSYNYAGIWSDLQDDDEFAAIATLRHES